MDDTDMPQMSKNAPDKSLKTEASAMNESITSLAPPINTPFGGSAAPCPLQMTVDSFPLQMTVELAENPLNLSAVKIETDTSFEEDHNFQQVAVKQDEIGDFDYQPTGVFSSISFTENVFSSMVKHQAYSSDTETEDNADESLGIFEGQGLTTWHEHLEMDTNNCKRPSNKGKETPEKMQQLLEDSMKKIYPEFQEERPVKGAGVEKNRVENKASRTKAKVVSKKSVKSLGKGKVQESNKKRELKKTKTKKQEKSMVKKDTQKNEKKAKTKKETGKSAVSSIEDQFEDSLVKSDSKVECDICQKKFANKKQLSKHKKRDHKDEESVQDIDKTVIISQTKEVDGKFKCLICDRSYSKRCSLSTHFKHDHRDLLHSAGSSDNKYVCEDCGRSYKWRQALQKHIQKDHGSQQSERFPCDHCNKDFKWKSALLVHVRTKHSEDKVNEKCPYCSKEYQWKQSLAVHIKHEHQNQSEGITLDETTDFACNMCQATFEKLRQLENHIGEVHGDQILKQIEQEIQNHPTESETIRMNLKDPKFRPFQCKDCPAKFRWQYTLSLHVKLAHAVNSEQFQCLICNRYFKYKHALRRHIRIVHLGQRDSPLKKDVLILHTKSGNFLCKYCPRIFKFQSTCSEHMKAEHPEGATETTKHNCPICNKTFLYLSTLQRHIANIHDENRQRNYFCDVCGAGFYEPSALKTHKYKHTTERKFVCQICRMAFKTWSNLRSHHLVHTNKRVAQCELCDKKFKSVGVKNVHIKVVHIGLEKKHICSFCDHAFVNKPKLRDHINAVHLKAQLYTCEECGKSFPTRAYLSFHRNVHHYTSKAFICDQCGKSFQTRMMLKKHVKYHSRNYFCTFCPMTFTHADILKSHVTRVHTLDARKFACSSCGRKYAYQSDKRKHESKCTGKVITQYELCWECRETFETTVELQLHIKDVHAIDWFGNECRECKRIFSGASQRRIHEKMHLPEKGLASPNNKKPPIEMCHFCSFTIPYADELKNHLEKVHLFVWNVMDCRHCTKKFTSCGKRRLHENLHFRKKREYQSLSGQLERFPCPICTEEFTWKILEKHVKMHGPSDRSCPGCSAKLTKWQWAKKKHKCLRNADRKPKLGP